MKKPVFTQSDNYVSPLRGGKIPMNVQMFATELPGDVDPPGDATPPAEPPENKPFDPKSLSPEALAYIDQQRTQASKTASKNTRTALEADEEFRKGLMAQIERENNMTVEEKLEAEKLKLAQEADSLSLRENMLVTTKTLLESGIKGEEADTLATLLTTTDQEVSVSNVNTFIETFNTALESGIEAMKQQLLQNGHIVNNSNSSVGSYAQRYQEAMEKKDTRAAIKIKREAFEKEGLVL